MLTTKNWQRHATATYFVSTFAISWGAIFAVVGRKGFPGTPAQIEQLLPWVVLAMLTGPSISGLSMTGLISGRHGYHRILYELLPNKRVRLRWYAMALLFAPLTIFTIYVALSLIHPMFLPKIIISDDKTGTILLGFAYGFAAGLFEELGWTAFVVHKLLSQHSILETGLVVGILWGAWHLLVAVWGSSAEDSPGTFSTTIFLPQFLFYAAVLPAYRVLMVWVYNRSSSLAVTMVMHASLTASLPLMLAPPATGVYLAVSYLVLAVVLWSVIAVGTSLGHFSATRNQQGMARQGLLLCGIASSLLYIAIVVLSASRWESYDSTSQTISELIAIDAPTKALAGSSFVAYSLLVITFGFGVRLVAGENLALRWAATGLASKEVLGLVVTLFFPIHQRGIPPTWTDTFHLTLVSVAVLLMLLALGAGAMALGASFRRFSFVTMILLIVGGTLAGMDGPKLAANIATPRMGIWQRIGVFTYMFWIAVLSLTLVSRERRILVKWLETDKNRSNRRRM